LLPFFLKKDAKMGVMETIIARTVDVCHTRACAENWRSVEIHQTNVSI